MTLLDVQNLTTEFPTEEGTIKAVNDVSLSVDSGEILGIVGESGSGKSATARSIVNMIEEPGKITAGSVRFSGEDLVMKSENELRDIRGNEIGIVFQDPMTALNPIYKVGFQIARVIRRHKGKDWRLSRMFRNSISQDNKGQAIKLMRDVRIPEPDERYHDYPHEFSGGMAQRALIAMAISCQPRLLIADEPTTGLDVTVQAEVFELLRRLQEELGISIILITHDLGVAYNVCDRIAVMYAGHIVEMGPTELIFDNPQHPYTSALLESIPDLQEQEEELKAIEGTVPSLNDLPQGCNFAPRCPYSTEACTKDDPPLEQKSGGTTAACIRSEEITLPGREP